MLDRHSRDWKQQPPTPEELHTMRAEDVLSLYNSFSGLDIEGWGLSDDQYDNVRATGARAREEILQRMERGRR